MSITRDALLEAGFKMYPQNRTLDRFDHLYQKKIWDIHGTRYFIDVLEYVFEQRTSWEIEITFSDGCSFHNSAAIRVLAYAGVNDWSVPDIEAFGRELWTRLAPNYYERIS